MKLFACLIFFLIFVSQYHHVESNFGIVFDEVQDSLSNGIENTREDDKDFLNLNERNTNNVNKIVFPDTEDKRNEVPNGGSKILNSDREVVEDVKSVTSKPLKNGTKDNRDGKENFNGGCLSDYTRVADGRCMKKF